MKEYDSVSQSEHGTLVTFFLHLFWYKKWYSSKVLFWLCLDFFHIFHQATSFFFFLATEPLVIFQKNILRVCYVASGNYMNVVLRLQVPMSIWKLIVFSFAEHLAIWGKN